MKQAQQGFTLIELMVTIAIIGILASIAIPSYQDSVNKSRRADVKAVLLGLANAMERHFTETNNYCDVGGGGGAIIASCGDPLTIDTGTPNVNYTIPAATATFYTITINTATANTYKLQAVPAGPQAGDKCGTLFLEHTGAKTNSTSATDCW